MPAWPNPLSGVYALRLPGMCEASGREGCRPATMRRWLTTSTGTITDWVMREAVPPAAKLAAAAAVVWLGVAD